MDSLPYGYSLIGEGGSAYVIKYETKHVRAAIKYPKPNAEEYLRNEIRILKYIWTFQPPKGFLSILYSNVTHLTPVLVMEFIEHETLNTYAMRRSTDRFEIMTNIVNMVQFLHSIGIAHHDINDRNILIGTHGKCWIIDFGFSLRLNFEGNHEVDFHTAAKGDKYCVLWLLVYLVSKVHFCNSSEYFQNQDVQLGLQFITEHFVFDQVMYADDVEGREARKQIDHKCRVCRHGQQKNAFLGFKV